MRILVTGGSGFVGRNLTQRLVEDGHEVTVTSTGSEPQIPGVHKILYMGLNGIDWRFVANKDAVIHLMANNDTLCRDEPEVMRANVNAPWELFCAARQTGCRKFVYASSCAVYGSQPAPYIEDETKVEPLNLYGRSKAEFDKIAMDFAHAKDDGTVVIGFRYCNIYGPGEDQKGKRMSTVGQLLRDAIKSKRVKLFEFGQQRRDWVYINDVVKANLLALESGTTGIYNIGSGVDYTFNEIVDEIKYVMDQNITIDYIPCPFADSYQNHTLCDVSKAKRELGFNPEFSLRSGIADYYKKLTCVSS